MACLQSSTGELLESPSKLVYPWSAGSTRASSPVGTRSTTNRQIDLPAEHHLHRNITFKLGNVFKTPDAMGHHDFAQWCETHMCSHTSEFPVSDADILCGRPLNCLSIHATYCMIVAGASSGETKMWAAIREHGDFFTSIDHVKTHKDMFEFFSPSGSHTILVYRSYTETKHRAASLRQQSFL